MKKTGLLVIGLFFGISLYAGEAVTINDVTAHQYADKMKVGSNLGNSLDALNTSPTSSKRARQGNGNSQETWWGNRAVTKADFDLLKALGFTTVRIPATWYEKTYYGTTTDKRLHVYPAWMNRVKQVVDWAVEDGLQVVLNIHHEQPMIYVGNPKGNDIPGQVYQDFHDLWTEIATTFRGYNELLAFEACNEVAPKRGWADKYQNDSTMMQMNMLNQIFVNTVRATGGNNARRVLVVPTLIDGSNGRALTDFVLPADQVPDRLIVQVHNYSYAMFDDLEPTFIALEKFSKKMNAPVMIGEFGTKVSNYKEYPSYRAYQLSNYVARLLAHGLCGTYWEDGNLGDFGLIDRRKKGVVGRYDTVRVNAILHPVAYKSKYSTCYNTMDKFVFSSLNGSTGELWNNTGWGSIVLGTTDKGLAIPDSATYISVLSSAGGYTSASTVTVQYVIFFDEKMTYVPVVGSKYTFYKGSGIFSIPAGAKYYRVSMNSSSYNVHSYDFENAFKTGSLQLFVGFLGRNFSDWVTDQN